MIQSSRRIVFVINLLFLLHFLEISEFHCVHRIKEGYMSVPVLTCHFLLFSTALNNIGFTILTLLNETFVLFILKAFNSIQFILFSTTNSSKHINLFILIYCFSVKLYISKELIDFFLFSIQHFFITYF